ncbi:NtaA/DmoA family FMN-dependent monooxygenase [Lichenifustis flavocetrariae]|uniref:NtaA/DmoA family FMN-dependent monooxygenase n=1 Tax=Lichenifustis flavocetrariae TaxID=2949735 RepID=A0AA41YZ56_9HYPH|nr:NtaA/DmoA family FMN-dependent monooxygenase [Lichenifustis flavocetrariae]MCW6511249.1 NtaA/DmoA family FMN-dependent monooxygenase [Lichenifustis flavocetrariae]
MTAAPFHMGWFLGNSFGVHGWNDPWGGSLAAEWTRPDMHIDLVRALERACFDFLLLEDSAFVPDSYGSSMDFYLRRAARVPKNDPLPLVPLLTQATRHLGIVPTISTSFYPPYLLARLIATLDLMSEGRVGCNFVTSTALRAAQNFGLDEHLEHDRRYEMADEFVEVVRKLWTSWDDDAVIMDIERQTFVDPTKVRTIDHKGRFFSVRGPLNTARPHDGRPVLVQAGGSPQGRHFAARHMDVVIAALGTVDEMKTYRADMRERVAAQGRNPDDCKVLFLLTPTLGDTDAEAQARYERGLRAKSASPENGLALMASLTDIDFAKFDLDEPLETMTTNGQQGTLKRFLAQGRTLREIAANFRFGFEDVFGTPDRVAAILGEVMAEVGGDGFVINLPITRRTIAEITDGLIPALQKRQLVRSLYSHAGFRQNLFEF